LLLFVTIVSIISLVALQGFPQYAQTSQAVCKQLCCWRACKKVY